MLATLTATSACNSQSFSVETAEESTGEVTEIETSVTEESTTDESTTESSSAENTAVSGVLVKTDVDDFEPYITSADPFTPQEDEIFTLAIKNSKEYIPSEGNNIVFPFAWSSNSYGLVNIKGEILTGGIFAEAHNYGYVTVLASGEGGDGGDYKYGLINKDGSKYTGCIYDNYYYDGDNVVLCKLGEGTVDLLTFDDDLEIITQNNLDLILRSLIRTGLLSMPLQMIMII